MILQQIISAAQPEMRLVIGVLKPGRMSMFGTLLIVWGLVKEGILKKTVNTGPTKTVFVYPTMLLALVCAFSSVKYDVKKVVRRSAKIRGAPRPKINRSETANQRHRAGRRQERTSEASKNEPARRIGTGKARW
ncbi:hypothetical protein U1Q18_032583 [Sarracenia purpurea var. burkii]